MILNFRIKPEHKQLLQKKIFGLSLIEHQILWAIKIKKAANVSLHTDDTSLCDVVKQIVEKSKKIPSNQILIQEDVSENYQPINYLYTYQGNSIAINSDHDIKRYCSLFEEEIRISCRGLVAPTINKRLSLFLSRILSKYNVPPNIISAIGMFLSVLAALLLVSPTGIPTYSFILFQLNSILDGCDGEVAKMNYAFSDLGKKIDVFSDYLTTGLIFLGSYFISGSQFSMWLISLLILLLLAILVPILKRIYKLKIPTEDIEGIYHNKIYSKQSFQGRLFRFYLELTKRDFMIFFLLLLCAFNLQEFIIPYLLFLSVSWIFFGIMAVLETKKVLTN